jgi:hypothetical protein
MLEAVNGQAQQLLDELAGQLKAKEIKNPLGYLRGLIANAKEGRFSAIAGIKVGEIRKQRTRIEASIKASEERATKPLEGPRREGVGKQLEELRKRRESLGATAHFKVSGLDEHGAPLRSGCGGDSRRTPPPATASSRSSHGLRLISTLTRKRP